MGDLGCFQPQRRRLHSAWGGPSPPSLSNNGKGANQYEATANALARQGGELGLSCVVLECLHVDTHPRLATDQRARAPHRTQPRGRLS